MDNAANRDRLTTVIEKTAFLPPGEEQPGGMPMTPEAMAAPPMDPAMAAGGMPMPPMDPAMAGGAPPMDPAMMGMPADPAAGLPPELAAIVGGMPADPAAAGVDPAAAGGAPDEANMITINADDFRQLLDTVTKLSKELANMAAQTTGGGEGGDQSDRMSKMEETLAQMAEIVGIDTAAPEAMPEDIPAAPAAPATDKIASASEDRDRLTKLMQ